jgi:hypothetical protein
MLIAIFQVLTISIIRRRIKMLALNEFKIRGINTSSVANRVQLATDAHSKQI